MKRSYYRMLAPVLIFSILFSSGALFKVLAAPAFGLIPAGSQPIFLPLITSNDTKNPDHIVPTPLPSANPQARQINAPDLGTGEISFSQLAIAWFGQISNNSNYVDVRVGYNSQQLTVNLQIFDHYLWFGSDAAHPENWDSATLYLNTSGNTDGVPGITSYRFTAQPNPNDAHQNYQTEAQGDGSSWKAASLTVWTTSGWRGSGYNDMKDARGWSMTFNIPYSSFGLSGPPPHGTVWGLAVVVNDRDTDQGTNPVQTWPESIDTGRPYTWGRLSFGLPVYTPPNAAPGGATVIRNKLNGANVPDAAVGGTTGNLCPGNSSYIWNQWGNANFGGAQDFNIQNQTDVADWPCFAKYYVTFPLDQVPSGKVVLSADLTLYEFGGSDPMAAKPSLIQALVVDSDWSESTLTWNNAPRPLENVSQTWVNVFQDAQISWPGKAYHWDLSSAVAKALAAGQPLRLAMYEADSDYHSGKYFTSSNTDDWDAAGRPTLTIHWGTP